jgi:hypothetical protein
MFRHKTHSGEKSAAHLSASGVATVGRSVALFVLCDMVRHIMARFFSNAISTNVTALAVPARTLVSPGTLVFLG